VLERFDAVLTPPLLLVPCVMQCAMMQDAKRHRPFITDLLAHGAGLREAKVMRMARRPCANEARLFPDVPQMLFVSNPAHAGDLDGFGPGLVLLYVRPIPLCRPEFIEVARIDPLEQVDVVHA
jgi:hypothetical protein